MSVVVASRRNVSWFRLVAARRSNHGQPLSRYFESYCALAALEPRDFLGRQAVEAEDVAVDLTFEFLHRRSVSHALRPMQMR